MTSEFDGTVKFLSCSNDGAFKFRTLSGITSLEVVQQDRQCLRLLTIILDNNTRGANDLPCVSLSVNDAKSSPFTQLLAIGNLDQVDVVFCTESFDQLVIWLRVAGFGQDRQMRLTTAQSANRPPGNRQEKEHCEGS